MRRDAWAGVAVSLLFSLAGPCAAQTAWQPSPGHTQVPIWPGAVPDARPVEGPEVSGTVVDGVGSKRLGRGGVWRSALLSLARGRGGAAAAGAPPAAPRGGRVGGGAAPGGAGGGGAGGAGRGGGGGGKKGPGGGRAGVFCRKTPPPPPRGAS